MLQSSQVLLNFDWLNYNLTKCNSFTRNAQKIKTKSSSKHPIPQHQPKQLSDPVDLLSPH